MKKLIWFLKKINLKKKKESIISIDVKVKKEEIGKNIYFLCGRNILFGVDTKYRSFDNSEDIDIFKNIKKDDIEIYINNKKYNFQRSFIPTKYGFYSIKFNFDNEEEFLLFFFLMFLILFYHFHYMILSKKQ